MTRAGSASKMGTEEGSLAGQVAVVTGASSGIGRAIALELASKGARLCLVGRSQQRMREVEKEATERGVAVRCYRKDLSNQQAIGQLARSLRKDHEKIHILVHSAGVVRLGSLENVPARDFEWQYRVNVLGPYLLTQLLLPALKAARSQVVFINSSIVGAARANTAQYAATKQGLQALADAFRQEVNPHGMRLLSVYPGRTATPMQAAIFKLEGKDYDPARLLQPEDVAAITVSALALPRTAEVTDIHIRGPIS